MEKNAKGGGGGSIKRRGRMKKIKKKINVRKRRGTRRKVEESGEGLEKKQNKDEKRTKRE